MGLVFSEHPLLISLFFIDDLYLIVVNELLFLRFTVDICISKVLLPPFGRCVLYKCMS